jgi:outer membrane lipoprotein carrier protein
MRLAIAIFFIATYAISARAGGLESLETFVKTAKSGRAEFTQVVTAPPRDGQAARSRDFVWQL